MSLLHTDLSRTSHASVHLANLAAQTGATLFTQERAPPYAPFLPAPAGGNWTYGKTEHLAPDELSRGAYTHLVVEAPPDAAFARGWTELGHVRGFDGWTLDSSWVAWTKQLDVRAMSRALEEGRWPLRMAASDKLVLLARSES
jgi:alpha-1,6-mannosyltransferase